MELLIDVSKVYTKLGRFVFNVNYRKFNLVMNLYILDTAQTQSGNRFNVHLFFYSLTNKLVSLVRSMQTISAHRHIFHLCITNEEIPSFRIRTVRNARSVFLKWFPHSSKKTAHMSYYATEIILIFALLFKVSLK